jgi:hypothetical protein
MFTVVESCRGKDYSNHDFLMIRGMLESYKTNIQFSLVDGREKDK